MEADKLKFLDGMKIVDLPAIARSVGRAMLTGVEAMGAGTYGAVYYRPPTGAEEMLAEEQERHRNA